MRVLKGQLRQASITETGYEEEDDVTPLLLSGDALLSALCGLDGVFLSWVAGNGIQEPQQLAFTFTGARLLEEEAARPVEQVIETLKAFSRQVGGGARVTS